MKKIRHNKFLNYIIPIIISVIIIPIMLFSMNGIPLFGVPKVEDIDYIEMSNTKLGTNTRKFTEIEDIENAINFTNFLSYKLGTPEQKSC
ncbi:hypothetical protein [Alkaliphilus flagellatus]|uniref:hypothetical protein n=1 Tax=Alkaliphilus flagellatus TaxID=2841507 RepID=UPI001FE53A4E|nr:hypothetical protein [Alkaliphilus flagellatus]